MKHWRHQSFREDDGGVLELMTNRNKRQRRRCLDERCALRFLLLCILTFLVGQSILLYRNARGQQPSGGRQQRTVTDPAQVSRRTRPKARVAIPARQTPSQHPKRYPPLNTLIDYGGDDNSHVRRNADLSFLLDFAIVGFAKSGTTTLSRYLSAIGAHVLSEERCQLVVNHTAKLVRALYTELPHGGGPNGMPRGLKCPQDLSSDLSMPNYQRFFNRTKLIVGVRNPVWYFQSFYNFRAVNTPWKELLPTKKLAKRCIGGSLGICGWRASFVDFLHRMGKTPGGPEEDALLELKLERVEHVGEVFFYELGQLSDERFRQDLGEFLGIPFQMPPIPHVNTAGRFDYIDVWRDEGKRRKIDICDEEHTFARNVLQDKARRASLWLRHHFLKSPQVTVSSRDNLVEILEGWMKDPCAERSR